MAKIHVKEKPGWSDYLGTEFTPLCISSLPASIAQVRPGDPYN